MTLGAPIHKRNWHNERAVEVIAHRAAEFIAREAGSESLITVIRAQSFAHGERVTVFVSVLPEEETLAALAFLERRRGAFSDYLKSHARLGPLPRIDFKIDAGELPAKVSRGPGGNRTRA